MVKAKSDVNLLWRKLVRDIQGNWKSFAAVFFICMISAMLYMGIDASWRGMDKNLNQRFAQSHIADIWITGEISDRKAHDIADLPGVLDTQRRVRLRATVDTPDEPNLELIMNEGPARINNPVIFEGNALPDSGKFICVLDSRFTEANGYQLGDTLTVEISGQALDLYIGGIGYSPEYVVLSDGYTLNVDPKTFGYAFLSPGSLAAFPYGETVVRLKEGSDPNLVKEEIQTLLDDPLLKVMTRDENNLISMAVEEVDQVRALGQAFPAIFFLVAALITFSTMKRLVDNQRMQIGTLCSLGYSRGQLIRHYTSFGLLISLFGVALGILGAKFILGPVIMHILTSIYIIPGTTAYMHPVVIIAVSLLTVAIAVGASFLSCYQALKEQPANLLRPKSPKAGRRVLVERVPFVWKHLSFSGKLITRNMLRNTYRFLIGIIGAVGCSMLLLTGFGMRDSVQFVLKNHYSNTMRYDVRVDLSTPIPVGYPDSVQIRSGAKEMETMMNGRLELMADDGWRQTIFYVLEDHHDMVNLERDGQRIWLPGEGIALTQRTADDMGLAIGDTIPIRAVNGHATEVTVRQIINIQLGQGIYVSKSAWRELDLMPFSPTTLLLKGGVLDLAAIEGMDGVDKVRTIEQEKVGNAAIVQVLNVLVMVMVTFAGALLFVVLYTLGQLNFFERTRELATLMVLGFYPRETKRLILRENILIAVLGLPVGLYLGPYLHQWVLTSGLPTILEFFPYISLQSWLLTGALTLLFAELVNLIIGSKFKQVDMVESLKSVE